MSQDIIIKVENLKKNYINDEIVTEVLDNLNFEVAKGEFLAIMGPSGSGKSTLMHLLGFLDTPTSGQYIFKGKDVSNLSDDELAKIRNEEVGFVFQTFNLLPKTSVFDNVKLPLLYSQLKDHNKRVEEAIKAVGLWHRAHNLSNQLSGGERQRVAIARALVTNPTVIFADEPTGNLDTKSGQVIMGILEKLNNEGHTIILVTHEQYTAQHAQRIIKLIDGQIVSDERVSERRSSLNGNNFLK